jgi:hypothetical protein
MSFLDRFKLENMEMLLKISEKSTLLIILVNLFSIALGWLFYYFIKTPL